MTTSISIKRPGSICMQATVTAIRDITPHLRRFSLQHEMLKGIAPLAPGAHFKVFISPDKSSPAVLPDLSTGKPVWYDEKTKPYIRTYTIRKLDSAKGILDVEFVLHGDQGPASAWAGKASVGDHLGIGLKSSGKIHGPSDWYLLAGDETAVPAITAMLENLPPATTGLALLEVEDEADTFQMNTDSSIEICWLIRKGMPSEQSPHLVNALKDLEPPDPALKSRYAWIAGEDSMVRAMRKYAIEELGMSREELHATVYWKAGCSEDDQRLNSVTG